MFIPKLRVLELKPFFNVRLVCNYLSPEKEKNKTLPFAERTYQLYPELRGALGGLDNEGRKEKIAAAVESRLAGAKDEINRRIKYFDEKFSAFIPGFVEAQCGLFNYEWDEEHLPERSLWKRPARYPPPWRARLLFFTYLL